MGSNQEIERIQEWITSWYGTSVENCPFSREDIRNICRGPMREVLVDFIVPRFRTDGQIKNIRSNLFLTDLMHSRSPEDELRNVNGGGRGDAGVNQDEEEIKMLKRRLDEIQEEKAAIVKQISKADAMVNESDAQLEKELLESVTHFDKLESRMQLITYRVRSTTRLLDDVCNIKPPNPAILDEPPSNKQDPSGAEIISPQLVLLKSIYSKASDLFNLYFLQNPPSFNGSSSYSSAEIQALSSAISAQTVELSQSGVKPKFIEKWARKEQELSVHQINKVEKRFANVMSPVEELANEAEALHIKLMKAHVNLAFKNRDLQQTLTGVEVQKRRRIQDVVLTNSAVEPADFLSYVQREEQQRKLIKCRELVRQLKWFDVRDNDDTDLLALICGESGGVSENKNSHVSGILNDDYKNSARSSDGGFNTIKQEVLEDITCALLKSYPDGKNKLQSTVSQCKNLVTEKFANLFVEENSMRNCHKLAGAQTERDKLYETLDLQVKIPQLAIKQDLISTNFQAVPKTNEQGQMDLLKEVLEMQNELKESRAQFEALFKNQE